MSAAWSQNLANELHRPIRRNFPTRRVQVSAIDEVWAADLAEMQKFSAWNKDIRYLLMIIDIFSKFGWIVPLKNKKGETVAKAFNKIFKSGRLPKKIWADKGSEFYNKDVNQLLSEKGIELYSTQNEQKSSVVERWIRTIKTRMWKIFTANNNTVYYDKLDKIVEDYNNTKHRSIRLTPREASNPKNSAQVYFNLYGNQ